MDKVQRKRSPSECVHCAVRTQSLNVIHIDLRVKAYCWYETVARNCSANWTTHNRVSSCWLLSAPVSQLAKCNSIRYKGIFGDVAVRSSPWLYHWPLRSREAVILQWRVGLMFIEQGCPYRQWRSRYGERIQTHWRMSDWLWLQSDCHSVVINDVKTSSDYDEPL
jgi:hypothetical protein